MGKNFIGLDTDKTQKLADALNELLSNYQIFYMNVRGYHWNIKGENFFELHAKFEELYDDLLLKIDEVAERVLTLGHRPAHAYTLVSIDRVQLRTSEPSIYATTCRQSLSAL